MKTALYSCVSKPGTFELIGPASGAGSLKGATTIVYRNVDTGKILMREPEEFATRMKKLPAPAAAPAVDLATVTEAMAVQMAVDYFEMRKAELGTISTEASELLTALYAAIANGKSSGEAV